MPEKQRILVTGAGGMLGSSFVQAAVQNYPEFEIIPLTHAQCDVTNLDAVLAQEIHKPNWIIHCAGLVNVDYCENNEQETRVVFEHGARNIARLAKMTGARVFYPQTFLIHDGKTRPILESTEAAPQSVYGRAKWEAEKIITADCVDALVVRMGGFFGGDERDKNFVGRFLPVLQAAMLKGQGTIEVGNRVWQPTYTLDLANNSLLLIQKNKSGVYNMASHGEATFAELARYFTTHFGWDTKIKVREIEAQALEGAKFGLRPQASVMANTRLQSEGLDLQRPWQIALTEYLNRPFFMNKFFVKNIEPLQPNL